MTATANTAPSAAPAGRHPLRQPLVWLVFGIPAATVVAGVFTIWIAMTSADRPIPDRFEKRGLAVSAPQAPGSTPPAAGTR